MESGVEGGGEVSGSLVGLFCGLCVRLYMCVCVCVCVYIYIYMFVCVYVCEATLTQRDGGVNVWIQLLEQAIFFGLIVANALILWKTMTVFSGSESPIVVVLSGSMRPAFQRGDLLFLTLGPAPLRVGEIVVYALPGRSIPIVHRIVSLHERRGSSMANEILTKGDNNAVDDLGLYPRDVWWLRRQNIIGRAGGFARGAGILTIIMNDHPEVKYVAIAILFLYVLINRDG